MSQHTFYRKYRSNTFAEIVGQTHIVETLKNAITSNRLTHAYIFSGPRGTGKTSIARILAKSLNCREGLSISPCLKCDICNHITQGTAVDVIEIDAASNTGVDNIRSLNDTVNFSPVECRYKLYIIDEAHMLSTGAFNALLKTLEEPPEKTIFILATTEPHKIPITIHSRCQHLHFRNLTTDEITSQLQHVAQSESLTIDKKGIDLIAKNSSGCMRDGLSLLNQAYSFKGDSITYEDILFILGTTEDTTLIQLLDDIVTKNHKNTLQTLQALNEKGANSTQLLTDIMRITTHLLHMSLDLTETIDGTPDYHDQLRKITSKTSTNILTQLSSTLANIEGEMRWFSYPSLLLQIRLIEFIQKSRPNTPTNPSTPPEPQASVTATPTPNTPTSPSTPPEPQVSVTATSSQPKLPPDQIWQTILNDIKKQSSALYALLQGSTVAQEDETTIYIKLKQSFKFFIDKLAETHHQEFINKQLASHFKPTKKFKLYDENTSSPIKKHNATAPTKEQPKPHTEEKTANPDTILINDVIKLFEGTIV